MTRPVTPFAAPSRRTILVMVGNGATIAFASATLGSSLTQLAAGGNDGVLVGCVVAATACLCTTPLTLWLSYRQDRRATRS